MKSNHYSMDWLSRPDVFEVNRLEPVSTLHYKVENKTVRQSLNGQWLVSCSPNISSRDAGFYHMEADVSGYDQIQVPGHLQLQGIGNIQYTNVAYPWDGSENLNYGSVPSKNNLTACYVKYFDLDPDLETDFVKLVFHGVESAFYVWLNGQFVGYSEDSFTPSAFDVTSLLKEKGNKLAVQVHQFSSGSWLEDQDFFRFSGIFRNVELQGYPNYRIEDLKITTKLTDQYQKARIMVDMKTAGENPSFLIRLKDDQDNLLLGFETKTPLVALDITDIHLWSAEDPYLYTLEIDVLNPDNEICMSVVEKVGLREFKMDKGLMKLNGKRIVFKGINRHEFNKDRGRAITKEDMIKDILFLKQHNINAVRTSHYPNQEDWYDLCDAMGIYLIDETNLETHGTWTFYDGIDLSDPLPGSRFLWKGAVLDRANSIYKRDKNHPSILIWSLGNESAVGDVLLEAASFFRQSDPDRLVHYEGCWNSADYDLCSDMYSRMYLSAKECEEYLNSHPRKPLILCEYSHAMGNSCGGLKKYTDLEEYSKYQGGFIWDFIDQAVETGKDGQSRLAYGGDFQDVPNDGNFCGNGILFADRTPSPKVQEVKHLYQDIKIAPDKFGVKIWNDFLFTPLSEFEVRYTLHKDGKLMQQGVLDAEVLPGKEKKFYIPWEKMEGELVKTVSVHLKKDKPWARAGHEIAFGQSIQGSFESLSAVSSQMHFVQGDHIFGCYDKDFSCKFSPKGLVSLKYQNQEMLKGIPKPVFAHAFTDNERGFGFDAEASMWYAASLFAKVTDWQVQADVENHIAAVVYTYKLPTIPETTCIVSYSIAAPGLLGVDVFLKGQEGLPRLPQLGLQIPLQPALDKFVFYGKGPMENYADRKEGARMGIFWQDVKSNLTPYLKPQECGARCDVRWLEAIETMQKGISFTMVNQPLQISLLMNSFDQIQSAAHLYDLPKSDTVYATICGHQMGVGGDDSWQAEVLEEYMLPGNQDYAFSFIISKAQRKLF